MTIEKDRTDSILRRLHQAATDEAKLNEQIAHDSIDGLIKPILEQGLVDLEDDD